MPMTDAITRTQDGKDFFVQLNYGGGLNTSVDPKDIHPRECQAGENFDLGLGITSFKPRKAFDLLATAPNAQPIQGFIELIEADGTVTVCVQAGPTIYQWDGNQVFTQVGTCAASSRLRGTRYSTSLVDNFVIITDLELLSPVLQWDGSTLSTFSTNLGTAFYSRYCVVNLERAWFGNVQANSETPHLVVASARMASATAAAVGTLTTSNRPSDALGAGDAFYLPMPDLGSINGMISAFDQLIFSTTNGSIWRLDGSSSKDYAFIPLYADSGAAGDEALVFIGNDALYGRPGKIEAIVPTLAFSDVQALNASRWIAPDIADVTGWTLVYNPRIQRIYAWAENGNEVWAMDRTLYDLSKNNLTGIVKTQDGLSPWMKWTTTYGNQDFRPTCAMLVRNPTNGLDQVLFGDANGNIYQLEGDGVQDGPNSVTNLLLQSADFGTTWSTVNSTVTTDTIAVLDGTSDGDTLTDSTTNGEHAVEQTVTLSPTAISTVSVWFKAKDYSRSFLRLSANSGVDYVQASYLLSGAGSVLTATAGGTGAGVSADIEQYSNGWYRCILSGAPATSGTTVTVRVGMVNNAGVFAFAGTGSSGIYVWAAQLQTGGNATSYVATTSASASYTAATNTSFRTSGDIGVVWRGPKDQMGLNVTDLKGYVRYRKGFESTLTHTAEWAGASFGDNTWSDTLPAFSNLVVFGGSAYFGGAYYFGTQYEGRASRLIWRIAGANYDRFGLKQSATGTQFDLPETGIQFQATA